MALCLKNWRNCIINFANSCTIPFGFRSLVRYFRDLGVIVEPNDVTLAAVNEIRNGGGTRCETCGGSKRRAEQQAYEERLEEALTPVR
mgnify:CR=1 FL=1